MPVHVALEQNAARVAHRSEPARRIVLVAVYASTRCRCRNDVSVRVISKPCSRDVVCLLVDFEIAKTVMAFGR